MSEQSRLILSREEPVSGFLLCIVLAKQARQLGRLMPDRRIAELITIAVKNCADYELALEPGVPAIVRDGAMQIGRITGRSEAPFASLSGSSEGSAFAHAVLAARQDLGTRESPGEASRVGESALSAHLVGSRIDSYGTRRDLSSVQRKHSMSNPNGMDPTRSRQLRAIAENLCSLANRHGENHNYVVAHALYGRALSFAQEIHGPTDDGKSLVARIRAEQQSVFEKLRTVGSGPEKPPMEKAKEVGR